jgi:hypothetical protein
MTTNDFFPSRFSVGDRITLYNAEKEFRVAYIGERQYLLEEVNANHLSLVGKRHVDANGAKVKR